MGRFILCCVFTSFFLFNFEVSASLLTVPNAVHPDHPDKCYYALEGAEPVILEPNQSTTIRQFCKKAKCTSDFNMIIESCGTIRLPPFCKFADTDTTIDYPECCSHIVCTEVPELENPFASQEPEEPKGPEEPKDPEQ